MKNTIQLRVRIRQELGEKLLMMPPRSRGRLVSAGVGAVMEGVEDLGKVLRSLEELRRIGVNLNQLVHLANCGSALKPEEGEKLRQLLADVRVIVG